MQHGLQRKQSEQRRHGLASAQSLAVTDTEHVYEPAVHPGEEAGLEPGQHLLHQRVAAVQRRLLAHVETERRGVGGSSVKLVHRHRALGGCLCTRHLVLQNN